jgi:hypothetical protein
VQLTLRESARLLIYVAADLSGNAKRIYRLF